MIGEREARTPACSAPASFLPGIQKTEVPRGTALYWGRDLPAELQVQRASVPDRVGRFSSVLHGRVSRCRPMPDTAHRLSQVTSIRARWPRSVRAGTAGPPDRRRADERGSTARPYQGISVEFAQHRPYVPGRRHPPRRLEGLFGRSEKIYLKQYHRRDESPARSLSSTRQPVDGVRLGQDRRRRPVDEIRPRPPPSPPRSAYMADPSGRTRSAWRFSTRRSTATSSRAIRPRQWKLVAQRVAAGAASWQKTNDRQNP